jgi:hypothetical protein
VIDAAANEVVLTDQNSHYMRAGLLGERANWFAVYSILIHGLCILPDGRHCMVANTCPAGLENPTKEPLEGDTSFQSGL